MELPSRQDAAELERAAMDIGHDTAMDLLDISQLAAGAFQSIVSANTGLRLKIPGTALAGL
jgi:hypothetical protein